MNGIVLKQRYQILGRAGQGGMGTVYRAVDTQLGDRVVAIKELQPTGQSQQEDAEAAAGFKREAIMLARLSHPSLPSIHDHFFEDGRWYLVMDYIAGETLEDRLQHAAGQGLPVAEVIRIGRQLCAVLDYLHSQQPPIIFRDLKPSNIMLTPDGRVYLIDFGIARFFKPGQPGDTEHLGTHGYAAPEQYSTSRTQTGARTDLYGLGATLHHALTGLDPSTHPFQFAPVRSRCPQAPLALESLIARLVRNDESQRPASAAEVRGELERIAATMRVASGSVAAGQPSWHSAPALSPAPAGVRRPTGSPALGRPPSRPITTPSRSAPIPRSLAVPRSHASRWSSARPDPAVVILAALLMAIIFGLCIWGTAWLGHSLQVLFSPPVVANLTGRTAPAVDAPLYTYRRHARSVVAVAWSPDGRRIASGSVDGTVRVWDAFTGSHTVVYHGQGAAVTAVAWSPDGARIASAGSDGVIHVWETATRRDLLTYIGHTAAVTALAWSPGGARIASGSRDATVRVWDAATGRTLLVYGGHTGGVNAVAWSPDGARIASGSNDRTVQVWDATTGGALATYTGHADIVWTVAWSPDGTRVASGSRDGAIQVWDPATAQTIASYHARSGAGSVLALAWSPNGLHIASIGPDARPAQVGAYGAGGAPSAAYYAYTGHSASVLALAWSPDGAAIASAGANATVQVWRAG